MPSGNKPYLNQYWPRSPTPYGITSPNDLKKIILLHYCYGYPPCFHSDSPDGVAGPPQRPYTMLPDRTHWLYVHCSRCCHSPANEDRIHALVQDCSNSSALAMELLQSCTTVFASRNSALAMELLQSCTTVFASRNSALAMELLHSCTKPSKYSLHDLGL